MPNVDPTYRPMNMAETRDRPHAIDCDEAEKMECPECGRRAVYAPYTGPRGEYIAVAECPLGHWEISF